jgi:hypothetical protein
MNGITKVLQVDQWNAAGRYRRAAKQRRQAGSLNGGGGVVARYGKRHV